jgi:hypothetical protein
MLQKLISNQPQWIAAVKHRERDVLTGRDETSVKVSYELGSYNMDDLYGYKENCGSSAACINEFISRYYDKIEAGNRLSFSAEYVRKDAYRFMMDGFEAFNLAKESSLIASAAYGRTFDSSNFLGGAEFFSERPARLDITLAYEDVDSDPMRNNRFVSSATVTQELAQGGFITLGMAYANKPEYLGEVDQELSARLGINFKLGSVE